MTRRRTERAKVIYGFIPDQPSNANYSDAAPTPRYEE
jgi:hypothetical protein